MQDVQLFTFNGTEVIDSRDVANMIGKSHAHLSRDIDRYIRDIDDYEPDPKLDSARKVNNSKGEREYRKKLKQMAKSQLDMTEYNFHPSNNMDSSYGVTVSVTAQLCVAANLIRVAENIEELSDKVGELNDTIYSYGKEKFSRKM